MFISNGTTFKVQSIAIANQLYIDLIHQLIGDLGRGSDISSRNKPAAQAAGTDPS